MERENDLMSELFGTSETKTDNYSYIWNIPSAHVQESVPRTAREIATHSKIACSISGGSDSDDMLDIVSRLDTEKKVRYVWFDTGIEMMATKRHLDYLEQKYGIEIERVRPKLSVGAAVRKVGYPFMSKNVSEFIDRLQKRGFQWEDGTYEELSQKYERCNSALRWWTNSWGDGSSFNIKKSLYLKEFMMDNPPTFKISSKCCNCGKKEPANTYRKNNEIDLTMIGIRKAEGGVRSSAYKSCMSNGIHGLQHFPLFWLDDNDKKIYEDACGIVHSDAYTVYGCSRTGCAGCPFGSGFEDELKMLEEHEPNLANAVKHIFAPSYEYTRAYRAYRDKRVQEKKEEKTGHQLTFDEIQMGENL